MTDERPTALITGGARGIGAAIARELARDHRVLFTYLGAEAAALALAAELPEAQALPCDLAEAGAPEALMRQVQALSPRLDLLVNAAGSVEEEDPLGFDMASAERQMRINALAPAALTAAAGRFMPRGGSVINITSVNATFPPTGALTYGASKAALENYTRGYAKVLGPQGIRVNAIAPGAVERDHAPRPPELIALFEADAALGSLATPEDIALAVRFLAEAKGVTGVILPVSRGFRL
ncbi:3-oxoacyl-[acyl-carrier protein] reductase [Pseudooceanicola antarcticus]|uniref:3-oxoacyl-[acyl-carrier protein] reductase n=1 Tax=Pseudooceanicola antarcticus TaxID=1247613 RepID=A0A285J7G3_9RHOB|nr:SDR family oxidoreductase [Pseudooceanicola antarcticus]PJE27048.1 NAD(P)-dependent oxidoreductase [Pseudooceanicola antarcticus]SNY56269.1 3-oxoacyl-[acyl-carrier protein] reductase [Pseudooceanicola antarcticus]